MVVLRNFCSKKWELLLHSDCRSKKFQEIESNRNVSLNFWDPKKSIQLELKVRQKNLMKQIIMLGAD